MKFITFVSNRDTEYCYNAESIQRVSWHNGSVTINIDICNTSYTHLFSNSESAELTYNNIIKALKGE